MNYQKETLLKQMKQDLYSYINYMYRKIKDDKICSYQNFDELQEDLDNLIFFYKEGIKYLEYYHANRKHLNKFRKELKEKIDLSK